MGNLKFSALMSAVLVGLFMGCTEKKSEVKVLKIHFPQVKLVLDPQKMEDLYSMAVVTQVYRGLLRYDAHGEVLPDLAESWSESDNHEIYRFKLKRGTFSDGTSINSQNVVMTFARMFAIGASMGADLDYISGVAKFKTSKNVADLGVKAVDPSTVEFHLDRPSALFLKQLAVTDCGILPITRFDQEVDYSSNGVFSGPYKVTSGPDNEGVTIEKWRADVRDSANPPKKVSYFFTAVKPVALALQDGTDSLDHDKVAEVDRQKLLKRGWVPTPTELTGEVFVILNPNLIPIEQRRELYALIDPSEAYRAIGSPATLAPAYGVIPRGLPGELDPSAVVEIKSAGIKNSGQRKPIELEYEQTSELEQKLTAFLKTKWEAAGYTVTLRPLSKGEKLQRMFGKKAQVVLGRKSLDYPDGISVLNYFKGSYESNYFYVNDPTVDADLLKAVQIFNSSKREQAYKEIQIAILKHYTIVPLLFGSEASGLWSKTVKSVPSHSLGYHTLPVESIEMRVL